MINLLASIINLLANLIVLLIIVDTILSFFLSPYNQIRSTLDRILQPLLTPIRKVVPLVGMFDFSPLILIIIIEILKYVLISFLYAL
jgi:YggT family protein